MPVAARVPALIDAVQDTCQATLLGSCLQQAMQTATVLGCGDFTSIGRAHGCYVRGIEDAGLEEGDVAAKFNAVDVKGIGRNPEAIEMLVGEQSTIREIVNGKHRWRMMAAPAQIRGRKRGRPIVEVEQVGDPVRIAHAASEICSRKSKSGKPQIVVRPVVAGWIQVRAALALIKFRADHGINHNPIGGLGSANAAFRYAGKPGQARYHFQSGVLSKEFAVCRNQDANVAAFTQRPRKGRRNVAQTADLDVVRQF
jgi:hypothetical protein